MTAISDRLMRLQPSATRTVAELAGDLRQQGRDVMSLSVGEPDFVSPEAVMAAAREAIDAGHTFYTPSAGLPELRETVAEYYRTRFGVDYEPSEVMVGSGAKPLLFEAFAALINPGDEVILTAPAWVSYIEQVRFLDGKPVVLQTDPRTLDFDVEAIRAAITPRTRAIVLNAPNNPSGRVYCDPDVVALCRLAVEHDLTIVNDEVYERLVLVDAEYRNPVALCPEARGHVININGASKAFAMTGWRIGFAVGPAPLIKRMIMFQAHLTSGANSIAQWATIGAFRGADKDVENMVAQYRHRRELILARLGRMPRLRCIPPEGAFYIFADITATLGMKAGDTVITDDVVFCEALLAKAGLALVPGTAFLQPGFVRISFATDVETIEAGMDRLHDFLSSLEPA
jgi:aspartate aminotransferase